MVATLPSILGQIGADDARAPRARERRVDRGMSVMGRVQPKVAGAVDSMSAMLFGDVLHGVLVRAVEGDRSPGLLTLCYPTGTGKSYAVNRAIATLASRMPEGSPPILFVTPQKKIIPHVDEIARLCREEGYDPGPYDVLRLLSASEMLARTAVDGLVERIPREHREQTNVVELIDAVRLLKSSKGYEQTIEPLVQEFKRSVRKLLPSGTWEERIECVESNRDWHWLADLWPTIRTRRAKVLLMTSSKFFLPHDTLLEAPCAIDEAEWVRGTIVFMDEFDSCKQDCLKAIASESTHVRADLASIVGSLRTGVDTSTLPESMLTGSDARRSAERLERLKAKLDETARETNLDYVYKAEEGAISPAGLFMYDGMRQGTSIGASYRVRTDAARRENVIVGKGAPAKGTRALAADVGSLRGAISYAQHVIASIIRDRHGWGLDGMDEEALQNEVLSTLDALGIKGYGERTLMLNGVRRVLMGGRRGHGSLVEGPTVYEQGFGLVVIEDSEDHRFATHLYAYAMDDTPETRLRSLVEGSLVIGLSATAAIDSPICNYDLQWLGERAPGLMRRLDQGDEGLLKAAYERHVAGYGAVDVRVVPVSLPGWEDADLYRLACSVVGSEVLRTLVMNQLSADCTDKKYAARRYTRIALAYRYFLENVPEGVFVCATAAAPKRGRGVGDGLRIETIEALLSLVRRDVGLPESDGVMRFIEGSEDFQRRYDSLVGELGADNPRMFVCAAYGSLSTGVNLQYDGRGMRTVSVGEASHDNRVDLVGVYLDIVTNVAPTYAKIGDAKRDEGTLLCAYELREMEWRGDITVDETDAAVRALVSGRPPQGLKLVDKPCVKAACTRTVVQMVGRMCRTSNKAPVIHVLYDEDLADRIDPHALDGELVGRETEKLLSEIASRSHHEPDTEGVVANRLAARGMATAAQLASIARSNPWTKRDMRLWEEARLWCLRNPCPQQDVLMGSGMEGYYVAVPQGVESYRYWEWGDFKGISVTLDMEATEDYPLEVSALAARLDLLSRVPEARELFEREGWPLRWEGGGMMMNPSFFRNVYLGALGERVGKAILESGIGGLRLDSIDDPRKFEKFDYVVSGTDVYVDFKNWRAPSTGGEGDFGWVREKMEGAGATRALVVNLFSSDWLQDKRCEEVGDSILAVPYIIDDVEGCVTVSHVAKIRAWLGKAGVLR